MLLSDVEFADRLGSSYFLGMNEATKKRRVRKMTADAGVAPVLKKKKDWYFREEDIFRVVESWDLKLKSEKDRHTGTSGAPSKVSRSSRAQDYLTPTKSALAR